MKVSELMTGVALVTASPDTAVLDARQLMLKERIRHLLVTEADGRLVGIVTDRDLRAALPWGEEGTAHPLRVKEVMTAKVITVTPDTRLERAARLMIERKIGSLPVVKRGALVGILTTTDLLRAMVEGPRERGTATQADLVGFAPVRRLEARRAPRPESRYRGPAATGSRSSGRS